MKRLLIWMAFFGAFSTLLYKSTTKVNASIVTADDHVPQRNMDISVARAADVAPAYAAVAGTCEKPADSLQAAPEEQSHDSLQVSLLTCTPGTEVYSLYGHTAIRCRNLTTGMDMAFNYGVFDFNAPHFVWHFVLGETDYELGGIPWCYFEWEYRHRGSAVVEQVLNLSQTEAVRLILLLQENLRPENVRYRYNYFYDNCTTRARDIIEQAVDGVVVYPGKANARIMNDALGSNVVPDSTEVCSYRSVIHQFTREAPWSAFGNDLLLGEGADGVIGPRSQMFSPLYLMAYVDEAEIVSGDGSRRKLVGMNREAVPLGVQDVKSEFFLSPTACLLLFLVVTILLTIMEWIRPCSLTYYDVFLLLFQGICGCLIAFMFFFSVHPTVGSNLLVLVFNPIIFCALPFVVMKRLKRWSGAAFVLEVLLVGSYAVAQLVPCLSGRSGVETTLAQNVPLAVHLFMACLLIRSFSHFAKYHLSRRQRPE